MSRPMTDDMTDEYDFSKADRGSIDFQEVARISQREIRGGLEASAGDPGFRSA
jgi:hypothetical protein